MSETAAGVTPGMRLAWPRVLRAYAGELFIHLAREAGNLSVVEPVGDRALLGALQPLDGFGLLVEIAGIFDLGLDRLQFVADFRRKAEISG